MLEVPQGVKISAYIFFAQAALYVCGLIAVGGSMVLGTGQTDVGELLITGSVASCLLIGFAVLSGVVGYGLLNLKSWARIAAIVLAILSLCSFPIGTILGGVVLYFMFQEENIRVFA